VEPRRISITFTVAGSLIAFLLQVAIAPNIAVYGVVPNLVLGFVVLNAMLCNSTRSLLTGFFLGLAFDFTTQGPLGVMALVLAVIGYSVSSLNKELLAGSWHVQALFLLLAAFLGELLYAAFLSMLGYNAGFLPSVGMRVLPGTLYDAVFGLIVFPLIHRFGSKRKKESNLLRGKLD
jgi:rod shape-determining protein MreD